MQGATGSSLWQNSFDSPRNPASLRNLGRYPPPTMHAFLLETEYDTMAETHISASQQFDLSIG